MIITTVFMVSKSYTPDPAYKYVTPRHLIKLLKAHNREAAAYIYDDAILIKGLLNNVLPYITTFNDPFILNEIILPALGVKRLIPKFPSLSIHNYNSQLTKILKQL